LVGFGPVGEGFTVRVPGDRIVVLMRQSIIRKPRFGTVVSARNIAWPRQRSFLSTALDKALDTAYDVALIARRTMETGGTKPKDARALLREDSDGKLVAKSRTKPLVLILGTGWAGHAMVKVCLSAPSELAFGGQLLP